jgi:hypothetical protein
MEGAVRAELARRAVEAAAEDVQALTSCTLGQRIVGSIELYPEPIERLVDEQLAAWAVAAYVYRPTGDELTRESQLRGLIPRAFDGDAEGPPSPAEVAILVRLTQYVLSRRGANPPAVRMMVTQAVANVFREGRRVR